MRESIEIEKHNTIDQESKAWFKRRILHVSNTIRIIFDGITKVRRLFQTSNFACVELKSKRNALILISGM